MKKILIAIVGLVTLCLSLVACGERNIPIEIDNEEQTEIALDTQTNANYSFTELSFEEAVSEYATDAVIAKYVSHKPFGEQQTLMEYEFIVLDRILGNAADRIFVYTSVLDIGENLDALNLPDGFTDSEYLLLLRKIGQPITNTHEDGFTFIRSIIINLEEPSRSTMNGDLLAHRSDNGESRSSDVLDFNKDLSRESVISYVSELTKDNQPGREPIKSEKSENIISNSPYVLIVEIDELLNSPRTDWASLDIYYCTAVETLKGDIKPDSKFLVSFPADTVKVGERHIVAVEQLDEGSNDWFIFTSKNSLFEMSEYDKIAKAISQYNN